MLRSTEARKADLVQKGPLLQACEPPPPPPTLNPTTTSCPSAFLKSHTLTSTFHSFICWVLLNELRVPVCPQDHLPPADFKERTRSSLQQASLNLKLQIHEHIHYIIQPNIHLLFGPTCFIYQGHCTFIDSIIM